MHVTYLVLASCCSALLASEEQRTWKYDGESCQGRAIVMDDQRVVIVQPDGQTKGLLRDRLGPNDQEYVLAKNWLSIAGVDQPNRVRG